MMLYRLFIPTFAIFFLVTQSHPLFFPDAAFLGLQVSRKLKLSEVPSKYYLLDLGDIVNGFPGNESSGDSSVLENPTLKDCPWSVDLGSIQTKNNEIGLMDSKAIKFGNRSCSPGQDVKLFNATFLQDSNFRQKYNLGELWDTITKHNTQQPNLTEIGPRPHGIFLGYIPQALVCGGNRSHFAGGLLLVHEVSNWTQDIPEHSLAPQNTTTSTQASPETDFMMLLGGLRKAHFMTLLSFTKLSIKMCHYTNSREVAAFFANMLQAFLNDKENGNRPPMRPESLADSFSLIKHKDTKSCPSKVDIKITNASRLHNQDSLSLTTISPSNFSVNGQKCISKSAEKEGSEIEVSFNISKVLSIVGKNRFQREGFTKVKKVLKREARWQIRRAHSPPTSDQDIKDEEIQRFLHQVGAGAAFAGYLPSGLVCGNFTFTEITPFVFINASPLDTFELDYRQYLHRPQRMAAHLSTRILSNSSLAKLKKLASIGKVPKELQEIFDDEEQRITSLHIFVENDTRLCPLSNNTEYSEKLSQAEVLIAAASLALESDSSSERPGNGEKLNNTAPSGSSNPDSSPKPQNESDSSNERPGSGEKLNNTAPSGSSNPDSSPKPQNESDSSNERPGNGEKLNNTAPSGSSNPDSSPKPQNETTPSNNTTDNNSTHEPTVTGEPTASGDDNLAANELDACFPASSRVELENGQFIPMDKVKLGDKVRVGPSSFEPIILFTHSSPEHISTFVRFSTADGTMLTITPNHYIPTPHKDLVASKVFIPGDRLISANGSEIKIENIELVKLRGLYNPHTPSGNIVVDNILTSTYTTAVKPRVAHLLLTPLRMLNTHMDITLESASSSFAHGSAVWPKLLPRGRTYQELL